MSVAPLIQQILNHPASAFSEADEAWLLTTPVEALQRILLTMESTPVATTNASNPVNDLKNDLAACQSDLKTCMSEELRIIAELASHGITAPSVVNISGVATNNAAALNDDAVYNYLTKMRTPLTTIVGEGMIARNETRKRSIDLILQNANSVYSPQDLEAKPTQELQKLVAAMQIQRPPQYQQWAGAAFADQTMPGLPQYTMNESSDGDPLEQPRLWGR